jgi:branched-chain amino acid transport system permease protein
VATILVNGLDGLAYGMMLFIVGAGLALIFGVMDVLNLAHGSLFLAGAYVASSCAASSVAGFAAIAALAAIGGGLAGLALAVMLRPLAGHLQQALLTLGLAFTASWVFTQVFGAAPRSVQAPPPLDGSISVLGHGYPLYRLILIGVAALIAAFLHLLVRHTPAGVVLRATVADPAMAATLRIRPARVHVIAVAAGAALAALAGVLGGPLLGPASGTDTQVLMLSLIVVVLGGAGSIPRTLAASLLVGLVQAFTTAVAGLAPFLLFAVVLFVLVVRRSSVGGVIRA